MNLLIAPGLPLIPYNIRLVLWTLAFSGAVALELITLRMIKDVNKLLAKDSKWRLGRWWFPWHSVMLDRQHRRAYPQSKLRIALWLITAFWFPLLLLLVLQR